MIKECLESFEKEIGIKGDKLILDNYIPADGTYIIVAPMGDYFQIVDTLNIKLDKKTKTIDRSSNYFDSICMYDYNSKLVDMNKPIDGKKIIHSNNYLSFFAKKESFINGKLTDEVIDGYYAILADPYLKYPKSKSKSHEVYMALEEEIGTVNIELLEKIRCWIKENVYEIGKQHTGKDYLKIFFQYDEQDYIREGKRYFIPNIYNSNDYNVKVIDGILGLPNDNMGMNAKKPYLENKTRKITSPYLINSEEVMLQKKFFDYLLNEVTLGKVNVYINDEGIKVYPNGQLPDKDFEGLYLRLKKGKEVEIRGYDVITMYKPNLARSFSFNNVLKDTLDEKSGELYGKYKKRSDIQGIIDNVFFSKYLVNNYFTDPGDISITNNVLKNNLLLGREGIFNWLYKGNSNGIDKLLDKLSLNILKGTIESGYYKKAKDQFNLRWSLKSYFDGGVQMAEVIYIMQESLRKKINAEVTDKFDNDEEYYFAVGQLVNYFLSLSKGKNKPQSLANPFVNAKNNEIIKEKLRALYLKYNYTIDKNSKRFNNLYGMILGYVPEGKVNQDLILAGYLRSNLVYEKNKEEK